MIDPRRVATLGIGYGALAVATLGLLGDGGVPPQPPAEGGQVIVRKAPLAKPAIAVPVRLADVGRSVDAIAPTVEVVPGAREDVAPGTDAMGHVAELAVTLASAGAGRDVLLARGEVDPAVTLAEAAAIVAWLRAQG